MNAAPLDLAVILNNLGVICRLQGRYPEAEALLLKAYTEIKRVENQESGKEFLPKVKKELAALYDELKQPEKAAEWLRRAAEAGGLYTVQRLLI